RFIRRQALALDEFVFERCQVHVIELKLQLEGPIRQTAALAQEGYRLIHDRDKVHPVSSLRLRRQRVRERLTTRERTQLNGRPSPATASAEGRQFNGAPSLPGARPLC